MKRQTFVKGSLILMVLGFISRAFGVFFKVPLDYLVGEQGQGLYYILYPVYAALIAMASVGLTVALSRQIAAYRALGKDDCAWSAFQLAFGLFFGFGALFSACIFFGSPYIIRVLKWPPETYWGLMGLVSAPFLVSLVSAFRGLFQGHENMVPTGVSMIIEQFARVVFGIGLTWYIMNSYNNIGMAVGGATFGAAAGGGFALFYLLIVFFKNRKYLVGSNGVSREQKRQILIDLVKIAIPVALGSAVISIMSLVDSIMLPALLTNLTESSGHALELIGGYSRANTIMNIPLVIALSISTSIVPFVAKAWEKKEFDVVKRRIGMGMKMGTFLAIPAATGIAVLSSQLISLVFSSSIGSAVLIPLALSLIFIIYAQIQTNVLTAVGHPVWPVFNMLAGVGVKVICNLLLLKSPQTNLVEVGLGVFAGYIVVVVLNALCLAKKTGYQSHLLSQLAKPLGAAGIMTGAIYVTIWVGKCIFSPKVLTLTSIFIGAVVYLVFIVKMKYLKQEEIKQIPGLAFLDKHLRK